MSELTCAKCDRIVCINSPILNLLSRHAGENIISRYNKLHRVAFLQLWSHYSSYKMSWKYNYCHDTGSIKLICNSYLTEKRTQALVCEKKTPYITLCFRDKCLWKRSQLIVNKVLLDWSIKFIVACLIYNFMQIHDERKKLTINIKVRASNDLKGMSTGMNSENVCQWKMRVCLIEVELLTKELLQGFFQCKESMYLTFHRTFWFIIKFRRTLLHIYTSRTIKRMQDKQGLY